MNSLVTLFLQRRGYTTSFLERINCDTHEPLMSIDDMCKALHALKLSGNKLVILPDFDMDGIMSGVVGFAGLSELGFNVALFRPKPSEGYGFKADAIDRLIAEFPDVHTIITCDVGITCYEGVDAAIAKGIDVLVTDHHMQEDADRLKASIIVNPNRLDETYANKGICGAHVFWQVLQRYADSYCNVFMREQIHRLRVFAGIGTISDAMPLLYENRSLVLDSCNICRLLYGESGLAFLQNLSGSIPYRRAFWGLHHTLNVFKEANKISDAESIDEMFFGFYLAPCFNSLKRLDGDMNIGFGVFFDSQPYENAKILCELNEKRKLLVASHFESLCSSDQPYAPYVYLSDAQSGILGLLATKLMQISGLPTMVLRRDEDTYHGSGRSPAWYSSIDILRPLGFDIKGHQGAFGLQVSDDNLSKLADILAITSTKILESLPEGSEGDAVDIIISLDDSGDVGIDTQLFAEFVHDIKLFKPFGVGFPPPLVRVTFKLSDVSFTRLGSEKQHLKIFLPQGFEVLCWNQAPLLDTVSKNDTLVVDGTLQVSTYYASSTVSLMGDLKVCSHE